MRSEKEHHGEQGAGAGSDEGKGGQLYRRRWCGGLSSCPPVSQQFSLCRRHLEQQFSTCGAGPWGGGVLITLPQGSLRSSENTCIYIAIHNSLHNLILCLVLNVIYTGYAWVYRSSPKLLPQDPTSNYNASFPLHLFSGHLNLSMSPQAVLPSLPNPAAQAKTLGPPCADFPFSLSLSHSHPIH